MSKHMNFMSENGVQSKRKDGEREKKLRTKNENCYYHLAAMAIKGENEKKTATTIKIE